MAQIDQLKQLISGLTLVQRISVLMAVLIGGGGIYALLHYHKEGDFRPLYSNMAPEDAAQVVLKLKEAGVEYRLTDSGATVSVPSARLADSRLTLASAGLPKTGRIGFELFDKTNFGATDLVEHVNYQRALEGELERSITSMAEVTQARVHLTFAKESVFLDQQQPAKASVMIKLHPGAKLSTQNVVAVSNLVASAVEGLSPNAVAVLDMDGNLLSRPRIGNANDSQITSEALEVRQQIERDLVSKINSTLEPLLGSSQFRAGATVDCDLTSGEQQEETFNPDQSVMVTSQKSEDTNDRSSSTLGTASQAAATGGVPGTQSNLPHPPQGLNGSSGSSHRTESIQYQTSRLVKHTRIPQGVIRRMSLSVLVGQPAHWEGQGNKRHRVVVPPSPETLKTIKDLVAGATGLNGERGDQLIVETLPFESAVDRDMGTYNTGTPAPTSSVPAWLQFAQKYQTALEIAVGALVALAIVLKIVTGMMRSKAKKKVMAEEAELPGVIYAPSDAALREIGPAASVQKLDSAIIAPAPQLAIGEADHLAAGRVRTLAESDPAAAANVLRMWLQNQRA